MSTAPRNVAVTGAAGGIGSALARGMAEAGDRVLCVDVAEEGCTALAEELRADGLDALAFGGVDLADPDATRAVVAAMVEAAGPVPVVVAVAGGSQADYHPFLEIEFANWRAMMARNVDSAFNTGQAFARHMAGIGGGSIVYVSSTIADIVMPNMSHYASSKGALRQLIRSMALELGPAGIRVNSIAPGTIRTRMATKVIDELAAAGAFDRLPLRRAAEPAELLGAVRYLASDEASYTTGANILIDGGFTLLQ